MASSQVAPSQPTVPRISQQVPASNADRARLPPPAPSRPAAVPSETTTPEAADDPSEAAETEAAKSVTAQPGAAHGFFARLAARLRAVFAIKPPDDDEDWGDVDIGTTEPAIASPPDARRHGRTAPPDGALEPPSPKLRPTLPPAPSSSPREPDDGAAATPTAPPPAATPPSPRRPVRQIRGQTTAAARLPIDRPLWQERLRRSRVAERTP